MPNTLVLDINCIFQCPQRGLDLSFDNISEIALPKILIIPSFQIHNKYLKGKVFIGVTAARFHSAIYTNEELFTFGLNAGQLGWYITTNFEYHMTYVIIICFLKDQFASEHEFFT